jgi:hypothetical protein
MAKSRSDFDSPWKEALELFFEQFLAFYFPKVHQAIDWTRGYQFLEQELRRIIRRSERGKYAVDKLVKVWMLDGSETWLLIHIEIQCQYDAGFPKRMHVYNYRISDYYNNEVISLALLADDQSDWRPDRYFWECAGFRKEYVWPVAKLLDYLPHLEVLEKVGSPFAVLTIAHLQTIRTRQDMVERRIWKIRLLRGLYERGLSREMIEKLFRLIDWLMDLPAREDILFWNEVREIEEEKNMPYVTSVERLGWARGHEEGKAEGKAEGKREALTLALEMALEAKFGAAGLALMSEINRHQDVQVLEKLLRAVKRAKTVETLRKLLPS